MIEKLKKEHDGEFGYIDEDGTSWDSPAEYLQIEILGFCGCGNPEEVMVYVKEMLEKLDNKQWGNYDDMPYMFFVEWADHNEFTEHGCTVRCSWLSDKGKELLKDINTCIESSTEDV